MVGRLLAVGGITGAIGDEDTIEMVSDLVDRVVEGKHGDAGSTVNEAPEDVLLNTTVDDSDVELRVPIGHVERCLGAHLSDKVDLLRIGEGLILVGIIFLTGSDTSQGRTLLPEVGDNGTGIDARDGRDTFASAPLPEALDSGPMAVLLGHIGDHNTRRLKVGGFKVLQETIIILFEAGHTIVANEGLGEDKNLPAVRRVGQRFGVADQGGRKDSLSRDIATSPEGLAVEDRTVTDRESSRFEDWPLAGGGHETRAGARVQGRERGGLGGHSLEDSGKHNRGHRQYETSLESG